MPKGYLFCIRNSSREISLYPALCLSKSHGPGSYPLTFPEYQKSLLTSSQQKLIWDNLRKGAFIGINSNTGRQNWISVEQPVSRVALGSKVKKIQGQCLECWHSNISTPKAFSPCVTMLKIKFLGGWTACLSLKGGAWGQAARDPPWGNIRLPHLRLSFSGSTLPLTYLLCFGKVLYIS